MSDCHTCKFAQWQRGESGRRLPNRPGTFLWQGKMIMAASCTWPYRTDLKGGSIWWKDNVKCEAYQK